MKKKRIKNKRAFTMIEVLGVLILMSIIGLIATPIASGIIKNNKENAYKKQIQLVKNELTKWAHANYEMLPTTSGGALFMELHELVENNAIENKLVVNPRDGGTLTGCLRIFYDSANQQYDTVYLEKTCTEAKADSSPTLNLVSSNIEVNTTYNNSAYATMAATTLNGKTITATRKEIRNSNNSIVSTIDTSLIDKEFTIKYDAYDSDLKMNFVVDHKVNVKDTIKPIIELKNITLTNGFYNIAKDSSINARDLIKVKDNSCGINMITSSVNGCDFVSNINSSKITVNSNVNTSIAGIYKIDYVVKDASNNTTVYTINVKVINYAPSYTNGNQESTTNAEVNTSYTVTSQKLRRYDGTELDINPNIYRNNIVVTSLNFDTIVNNQYLLYSYTEPKNNITYTKKININVNDTKAPTIVFKDDSGVTNNIKKIKLFDSINLSALVQVSDNSCGINGVTTTVNNCSTTLVPIIDSNVNTSIVGNYNVLYTVKDSSNNSATLNLTVQVQKLEYIYNYTGAKQEFKVPRNGVYKFEAWGAAGGGMVGAPAGTMNSGKGAYTKGEINLVKDQVIYIYVGESPSITKKDSNTGGYNGGGHSGWDNSPGLYPAGGGGATDFRTKDVNGQWDNDSSLNYRIMVAAGGAGGVRDIPMASGGNGGTLSGQTGTAYEPSGGLATNHYSKWTQTAPTQTSQSIQYVHNGEYRASFGKGCDLTWGWGGGGGSGYYAGVNGFGRGGAGGSSYISESRFTETEMKAGNESMPNLAGGNMVGNAGHGFARITFLR